MVDDVVHAGVYHDLGVVVVMAMVIVTVTDVDVGILTAVCVVVSVTVTLIDAVMSLVLGIAPACSLRAGDGVVGPHVPT